MKKLILIIFLSSSCVTDDTRTGDKLYNDKRYSVSSKKIQKLGWKPKRNLLKDLPMIVEWYKKNYKIFYSQLMHVLLCF